jgi:hypothetical protein
MRRFIVLATSLAIACAVAFAAPVGAGTNELELTKQEFRQSANETCADAYDEINDVFQEELAGLQGGESPSEAQVEAAIGSVVEILDAAATDIRALVGPPRFEAKVERFIDQFDEVVAEFEDDPKGMFEEELTGYPFKKPDRTARKLGLSSCAQRQG